MIEMVKWVKIFDRFLPINKWEISPILIKSGIEMRVVLRNQLAYSLGYGWANKGFGW